LFYTGKRNASPEGEAFFESFYFYHSQNKQEIYLKAAVFSKKLYLRMKIW